MKYMVLEMSSISRRKPYGNTFIKGATKEHSPTYWTRDSIYKTKDFICHIEQWGIKMKNGIWKNLTIFHFLIDGKDCTTWFKRTCYTDGELKLRATKSYGILTGKIKL